MDRLERLLFWAKRITGMIWLPELKLIRNNNAVKYVLKILNVSAPIFGRAQVLTLDYVGRNTTSIPHRRRIPKLRFFTHQMLNFRNLQHVNLVLLQIKLQGGITRDASKTVLKVEDYPTDFPTLPLLNNALNKQRRMDLKRPAISTLASVGPVTIQTGIKWATPDVASHLAADARSKYTAQNKKRTVTKKNGAYTN